MLRAEVRDIVANDLDKWELWIPSDPLQVYQWFTISVGVVGQYGADNFQLAAATREGRPRKSKHFSGIIVDEWNCDSVSNAIVEYVSSICGDTWEDIVRRLEEVCYWEYSRRSLSEYG